jgi:hypothetical protein
MVCPEFAHNAVLYFSEFRFFDPAAQGRFEALMRCMEGLTLAEFAWGVEKGCVADAAGGGTFRWFHEEMVRANDPAFAEHLGSAAYRAAADAARDSCRLAMDPVRLGRLRPVPVEGLGSPDDDGPGGADRD